MEVTEYTGKEVGYVQKVKHYLLTVNGLPSAKVNDIIIDQDGNRAIVNAVFRHHLEALLLDKVLIGSGARMEMADSSSVISVGDHLFGSIVDALGNVVARPGSKRAAGKSSQEGGEDITLELDVGAPGVDGREMISEQLFTGFSAVDILVPIGKGQRELIFGSKDSGKIRFLLELIKSQKGKDVVCIYAAIGKPASFLSRLVNTLRDAEALEYTVIVSALSTSSSPEVSIAPSTAFLMAEYFARQGRDVVLVLDDLGVHAEYIREIALLSGRVPGRESYPGDIFYQHAHLMERAGRFNATLGSGSITLFPVMETGRDNYTSLIPTNLMASTDGHLMFSADQQTEGVMPAVSVTESVTRIGHHTQSQLQREISNRLLHIISEYPRQQEYSRFGTQLTDQTKRLLVQGELIQVLLNQDAVGALHPGIQVILCSLIFTSLTEEDTVIQKVRVYREDIIKAIREHEGFTKARELVSTKVGADAFIKEVEKGVSSITALW